MLEAGHPHALLNTPQGLPAGGGGFRDMVHQTGSESEATLRRAARVAWESRRQEKGEGQRL